MNAHNRIRLSTSALLLQLFYFGGAEVDEPKYMRVTLVYSGTRVYFGTPEVEEGVPEKRYDYTLPTLHFILFHFISLKYVY